MAQPTIGILGGGQLGLMTAHAAARLGIKTHVYCSGADEPALTAASYKTIASFDDSEAVACFAREVDVVTYEWENVPLVTVEEAARYAPVLPRPSVLRIAQDRGLEKKFARNSDIGTPDFEIVRSADELAHALERIGRPSVLKSTRMGYDGKGQVLITPEITAAQAWARMGADEGILESFVDFEREISVIVARRADGRMAFYPPVENVHNNHILSKTTFPAQIDAALADEALAVAGTLAREINVIGLLAIEMFVLKKPNAQGRRILMNEIAPRPHNSGHWTIDACPCSQFEQLIRAICGMELGDPTPRTSGTMFNLLGDEVSKADVLRTDPAARVHLYGKKEVRPGRKMGHVTFLGKEGRL